MKKNKSKKSTTKNILVAFILNLLFTILEFVGGAISGSVAILSDAFHDLGDSLSLGTALVLEKKSNKKPDEKYTYGYKRLSVMSTLILSFMLVVGSVLIVVESIKKIIFIANGGIVELKGNIMIIVASIGLLLNGIAFIVTSSKQNSNEKVINLHMLEDYLGLFIILLGSIFIVEFNLPIIDPILSILVASFIFIHALKHAYSVIIILLGKAPKNFSQTKFKEDLLKLEGIKDVHHIHIWQMNYGYNLLTMHVVLDKDYSISEINSIKKEINHISKHHKVKHLTIQFEYCKDHCHEEICAPDYENEHHGCGHNH